MICNPLAMTTITSKKICRHLNFIEFHKRLTPNKTTFQKITGHLPPIVGRWINSALGNKLKKNISTQMSCFFSPWVLHWFSGVFLVNSWPTYFLKVNNSWWNHIWLQWSNALTNHQGLPFFLPQGTKETSVQLLTKEPGIHLTGLTLLGDARFGRWTFGKQRLRHCGQE